MRVGIIVLVVVAVLAATLGLLWLFQRRLLYFPSPGPVPPAASVLPGAEDVAFETTDGLRLAGWFVPAQPGAGGPAGAVARGAAGAVARGPAGAVARGPAGAVAKGPAGAVDSPARPSPEVGYAPPPGDPAVVGPGAARARLGAGRGGAGPAVLVCNGNGGDRSMRAPLAAALSRMGLAVLLFDYRGYGGNPGHPTEEGLAADARAALGYLAGRPEVDPARVIYFGESLGAAVALRLATERPPAALVLRSPFASLAEVGRRHYPVLPVSLLLRDRYDSAALAGRLDAPLLVVAGGRDQIVPASHSRRLFDAAPQPKRLVVLDGADHNDDELLAGPRLLAELRTFLDGVGGLRG
jgi:uncharacterized protein